MDAVLSIMLAVFGAAFIAGRLIRAHNESRELEARISLDASRFIEGLERARGAIAALPYGVKAEPCGPGPVCDYCGHPQPRAGVTNCEGCGARVLRPMASITGETGIMAGYYEAEITAARAEAAIWTNNPGTR